MIRAEIREIPPVRLRESACRLVFMNMGEVPAAVRKLGAAVVFFVHMHLIL